MNVVAMETFLQDKDLWIAGSVCLVASLLWGPFWNLFAYKRKKRISPETPCVGIQVKLKIIFFLNLTETFSLYYILTNPHYTVKKFFFALKSLSIINFTSNFNSTSDKLL